MNFQTHSCRFRRSPGKGGQSVLGCDLGSSGEHVPTGSTGKQSFPLGFHPAFLDSLQSLFLLVCEESQGRSLSQMRTVMARDPERQEAWLTPYCLEPPAPTPSHPMIMSKPQSMWSTLR